jgi:hypothetical protein
MWQTVESIPVLTGTLACKMGKECGGEPAPPVMTLAKNRSREWQDTEKRGARLETLGNYTTVRPLTANG